MNIRDIARLANVTPGTVSKVLNNYPDISEATRKHVLSIINEHQYDPKANSRANSPAPGRDRIGLVVESVYNTLYSQMEDVLSLNLHNSGFLVSSFHDNFYAQDKREKFVELKTFAAQENLCGLIYIGGNFECLTEEDLSGLPCPTVFVNTVLPFLTSCDSCSSVQVSHFETAYNQMQYLIDRGHQNICTVISSFSDNSVYGLRVKGYRAALAQSHLEHNFEHVIETGYIDTHAYKRLKEHLLAHPEITAVCSVTDMVVPGIIRAIHDAGRAPGTDVEIISLDGLSGTEFTIPATTTFAQPVNEMVSHIDKLLLGLISKQRPHQHITFRPTFIKRESC